MDTTWPSPSTSRGSALRLRMAQAERVPGDSTEVAALRKKMRGEPLTAEEQALLARATRKPTGEGAVPQETIEAMLEERRRLGG